MNKAECKHIYILTVSIIEAINYTNKANNTFRISFFLHIFFNALLIVSIFFMAIVGKIFKRFFIPNFVIFCFININNKQK